MSSAYAAPAIPGFSQHRYILKRNAFSLMGRKSRMFDEQGNLLFYCERKAFKLKEEIRVFADESKTREMLLIKARSVFDFGATYDVTDATSRQVVGALRRKGMKSILRDEWEILAAGDQAIGKVSEDNAVVALLRRFVDIVSLVLPQSYHIEVYGQPIGAIKQNFNPFTLHYTMDLTGDTRGALDRRLAVALAILLLNVEGRQQ